MSIIVALELHYFQELLNWWHSTFKRHGPINVSYPVTSGSMSQYCGFASGSANMTRVWIRIHNTDPHASVLFLNALYLSRYVEIGLRACLPQKSHDTVSFSIQFRARGLLTVCRVTVLCSQCHVQCVVVCPNFFHLINKRKGGSVHIG
jgi:hypothetical protein